MHKLAAFSIAAVMSFGTLAAEPEEGFEPIFNGENLDGWVVWGNPDGFEVVDGVIRSEPAGIGYGMYYAEKQFSDFILRLEWRLPERGNSGVFIRAPKDGPPETNHPWVSAYEVQLSYERPERDDIHTTGALYGYAAVEPRLPEKHGEWRTFEITCAGPEITVKLDGVAITRLNQAEHDELRDKPLRGYIALQDNHGPENTYVEYRNIRVKDLSTEE